MLTTSIQPEDLLVGEVLWAMTRSLIYGASFFRVIAAFGLAPMPGALRASGTAGAPVGNVARLSPRADGARARILTMRISALRVVRVAVLVTLSAVVLTALFVVSWLIYMPVMALVVAPFTIAGAAIAGIPPSAPLNSIAAATLAATLAYATVNLVFRVLLRRARARNLVRFTA